MRTIGVSYSGRISAEWYYENLKIYIRSSDTKERSLSNRFLHEKSSPNLNILETKIVDISKLFSSNLHQNFTQAAAMLTFIRIGRVLTFSKQNST